MGLFNDAKKNLEDAKRRLASVSGLDSKEAREGITQIKNGISKIGHQLKDVDKSSVQSVQASIDSGVDKASRSEVLQSAADSDPGRSSGRASSILDHTNVFLGSGRNFRIYQIIWIILHDQISNAGKGCIVCTGTWTTANADCHLST